MDEQIKDAFGKVKSDLTSLNDEVSSLREELNKTKEELVNICEILLNMSKKLETKRKTSNLPLPTHKFYNPTQERQNPTHLLPLKPLKADFQPLSNGNEGVPTDRQTDQQTDNPTQKKPYLTPLFPIESLIEPFENQEKTPKNTNFPLFNPKTLESGISNTFHENQAKNQVKSPTGTSIDNALKILDSLDSLKKEIRLKFKRLTSQEMTVFSTIYQMEEETGDTDYRSLALKLGLTESSVRDYVGRIISKGIPVDKTKINNKTIKLSIPQNLKRVASLPTILQLRDL